MSQVPDDHEQASIDQAIQHYYGTHFDEAARLVTRSTAGKIELLRTREIVERHLRPSARVVDIGGGTGVHATWLAEAGHDVRLLEPVPEQVKQAAAVGTFEATVGDARELPWPDDSFDAALMCGPLYHLAARADRLRALTEATRVTRTGGVIFAAAIPRIVAFGSAWVGRPADDPLTPEPLTPELVDLLDHGSFRFEHIPFPGAHFHTAEELIAELSEVGLTEIECEGLEGPAGLALEARGTEDDDLLESALAIARRFGQMPGLRDLSNHMLAWGTVT